MQGQIVEFSVVQGIGKITCVETNQTFLFAFSQWMGRDLPEIGQIVDFEINHCGHAVMITALLRSPWKLAS